MPDVVAGREDIEALLAAGIRAAADGDEAGARPLQLLGPRGVGKTVLCTLAEEMAVDAGVPTVSFAGAGVSSKPELLELLAAPRALDRVRGLRAAGFAVDTHPKADGAVQAALVRRAAPRGLVCVVDEAHELHAGVAHVLLNAVQRAGRRNVFLVVAGTPALDWKRRSWRTTFDERFVEKRLGPLAEQAVREAIVAPLGRRAEPMELTEAAIGIVVDECMGFPFFVQVWGELIDRSGATVVDESVLERLRPGYEAERDGLYRARWRRLRQSGLAVGARALVEAGLGDHPVASETVYECVAECYQPVSGEPDSRSVEWIVRGLVAEGVLWDPVGGMDEYVAGTPPTMTKFLAERPVPTSLETEGALRRFLDEQEREQALDEANVSRAAADDHAT